MPEVHYEQWVFIDVLIITEHWYLCILLLFLNSILILFTGIFIRMLSSLESGWHWKLKECRALNMSVIKDEGHMELQPAIKTEQVFSISVLLKFWHWWPFDGRGVLCIVGCLGTSWMSTHYRSVTLACSHDNQKCLRTLPRIATDIGKIKTSLHFKVTPMK